MSSNILKNPSRRMSISKATLSSQFRTLPIIETESRADDSLGQEGENRNSHSYISIFKDAATSVPKKKKPLQTIHFGSIDRELKNRKTSQSLRHKGKNMVNTTRYTWMSAVPRNLMEQFRRRANIFFFAISILQVFRGSNYIARFATLFPFVVVLLVTLLKEVYEDYKRYLADTMINSRKGRLIRNGAIHEVEWQDMEAGDIVEVLNNEQVPVDLVILSIKGQHENCFIETSNLDGESHLKTKQAITATQQTTLIDDISQLSGKLECEAPTSNLHHFDGRISFSSRKVWYSVNIDNIIWRGTILRNTDAVYGLVVYTGHDTRMVKNSFNDPLKRSSIDRNIDSFVVVIIFLLIMMCFVSTTLGLQWIEKQLDACNDTTCEYLYLSFLPEENRLERLDLFIIFLILFNNLIPISLYISLEFVKFVQAWLISSDIHMYYAKTDTPTIARTSALNEDLGQIQYIFTDKTGTLTRNQMVFQKCSVGGEIFEFAMKDATVVPLQRAYDDKVAPLRIDSSRISKEELTKTRTVTDLDTSSSQQVSTTIHNSGDEDEQSEVHPRVLDPENNELHEKFVLCMALCHSVNAERKNGNVIYQGSSPDEVAIVEAAKKLGYTFFQRSRDELVLKIGGRRFVYELLGENHFSTSRRKMSVIVRDEQGCVMLFCKGADEEMIKSLSVDPDAEEVVTLKDHLFHLGSEGLRTLVMGYKKLDRAEFDAWNKMYQEVATSFMDRTEKLEEIAESIETRLQLLGASGTEDRLQDGVPQAISCILSAGIKVWMATGDKLETAVTIGYSCRLLSEDMDVLRLDESSKRGTMLTISKYLDKYKSQLGTTVDDLALVISSKSLLHLSSDHDICEMFVLLAIMSKVLIACRCTPFQKAWLIRLIKSTKEKEPLTLAIGDGANDVSMIREAHVGIGISGDDGTQAVRASDYSIGQFKYLSRLLLVHGHWSYKRIANLVLYSFYKNMALAFCQFLYAFDSGFSGASIFDSILYTGWNVAFTTFPILVSSVLDQDVSALSLLRFPALYQEGQSNLQFTLTAILGWTGNALMHSASAYFLGMGILRGGNSTADGRVQGLAFSGTVINLCMLLTVSYRLCFEINYWTLWHIAAFIVSIASWILFLIVSSSWFWLSPDYSGFVTRFFGDSLLIVLLTVALVPTASILVDVVLAWIRGLILPRLSIIVRQFELLVPQSYQEQSPEELAELSHDPDQDRNSSKGRVSDDLNAKYNPFLKKVSLIIGLSSVDLNDVGGAMSNGKRLSRSTSGRKETSYHIPLSERITINPFTCAFQEENELEESFLRQYVNKSIPFTRIVCVILYSVVVLYLIFSIFFDEPNLEIRVIFTCCAGFVFAFVFTSAYTRHFALFNGGMLVCSGIIRTLLITDNGILGVSTFTIVVFLCMRMRFIHALIVWMIDFTVFMILSTLNGTISGTNEVILFLSVHILIVLFSSYASRRDELALRKEFILQRDSSEEKNRVQIILDNMLPPHINRQIAAGQPGNDIVAEGFSSVSVFFCDIQHFSKLLTNFSPEELVMLLDTIYSMFDVICDELSVQKVETVGKTYMACAGTEGTRVDHAMAVAEMGMKILELFQKTDWLISVRIGINSGPVLCGVVGVTRPQFCLVGDTVNTASRMQSTGIINRIHISSATHARIRTQFTFESRQVEAKGKGLMVTYLIKDRLHRPSQLRKQKRYKLVDSIDDSRIKDVKMYIEATGIVRDDEQAFQGVAKMHRFTLEYINDSGLEERFQAGWREELRPNLRRPLILVIIYILIRMIYDASFLRLRIGFVVGHCLVALISIVLMVIVNVSNILKHQYALQFISFGTIFLFLVENSLIIARYQQQSDLLDSSMIDITHATMFLCALLSTSNVLSVVYTAGYCMGVSIMWTIYASLSDVNGNVIALSTFFIILILSFSIIIGYGSEMHTRREFVMTDKLTEQKESADNFLYSMLPAPVATELKVQMKSIAEEFSKVTLLYSDIRGFTKFASSAKPEEVISLLCQIFKKFDRLTHVHETYKVQTIGDAYVLLAGVPFVHPTISDPEKLARQGAINVVTTGLRMIDALRNVRTSSGGSVKMRIGVHTGTIVAGCIGTTKIRYDMWGNDCLVANTLESKGVPDHVVVSSDTAAHLDNTFLLEKYDDIRIHRATIKTFIVKEKNVYSHSFYLPASATE